MAQLTDLWLHGPADQPWPPAQKPGHTSSLTSPLTVVEYTMHDTQTARLYLRGDIIRTKTVYLSSPVNCIHESCRHLLQPGRCMERGCGTSRHCSLPDQGHSLSPTQLPHYTGCLPPSHAKETKTYSVHTYTQ